MSLYAKPSMPGLLGSPHRHMQLESHAVFKTTETAAAQKWEIDAQDQAEYLSDHVGGKYTSAKTEIRSRIWLDTNVVYITMSTYVNKSNPNRKLHIEMKPNLQW